MKKIMEIPGGRGSNAKPSGTENPVGWGVKLEKTLRGGGMDIFWNHTFHNYIYLHQSLYQIMISTAINMVNPRIFSKSI